MSINALRTPAMFALESLSAFAAAALFVAVASRAQGPAPSLFSCAAALLFGAVLIRVLQRFDMSDDATRRAGLPVLIAGALMIAWVEYAVVLGSWSPGAIVDALRSPRATLDDYTHVVMGVTALCAVAVRGVVIGRAPLDFEDLLTNTSVGLVVVVVAAVARPSAGWPDSFALVALVYVVLALVTLMIYRAPEPDASAASFAGRWSSLLVALVGGAAALALVSAALNPEEFGFLEPVGEAAAAVGGAIVYVIVAPIFWVLGQAIRGLAWMIALVVPGDAFLPQEDACRPLDDGSLPEGCEPTEEDGAGEGQPMWLRVFGFTVMAVLGGAVLLIALGVAYQAFRRYAQRQSAAPGERRDDVEPASGLGDDLAALFGALRRPFRRSGSTERRSELHRVYFEMLGRAERDGVQRSPPTTPQQFAPSLESHFRSDVPGEITRAFEEVRYGEVPADPAVARELHRRWRALESRD